MNYYLTRSIRSISREKFINSREVAIITNYLSRNFRLISWERFINSQEMLIITLFLTGVLLTFYANFIIKSPPLGAMGISAGIIGLTALFMKHSLKYSLVKDDMILRQKLKRFVLYLAAAFGGLNIIILLLDRNAYFSVYFIADALAFLVLTVAYNNEFGPRAKTGLNAVATIIFAAFVALVVYKLIIML